MDAFSKVAEIFGGRNSIGTLSLMTKVNHDLHILGDDAEILMEEFAVFFDIDMKEFVFSKYFEEELIVFVYWYYLWFQPSYFTRKKPLTIGHLVEIAEKKIWFDP